MRDASPDSVTPGGAQAPLGAREAVSGRPATNTAGAGDTHGADAVATPVGGQRLPLAGSAWIVVAILVVSLLVYAAIAADVVEDGRLSSLDEDLSAWVARSMPAWAEWLARPFSWVGGTVGVILVVTGVAVWLVHRREPLLGVLVVVVALGAQLLMWLAKNGYDRPRPTAGSPIDIPSSWSFPSGHALTGIAVFGLLGLVLARELGSRPARRAAIVAGFVLGALIGASRVVLNVHYLTDVLGGAALGLAWLAACLLACIVVGTRRCRYADPS